MRAINNWNDVKASTDFTALPAGGYVCRIQGAKIRTFEGKNGSFERLEVAVDICEGEYKDHFRRDFDSQNTEDKKWRGVFRLYVPSGDGSDQDNWSAAKLKRFVNDVGLGGIQAQGQAGGPYLPPGGVGVQWQDRLENQPLPGLHRGGHPPEQVPDA